MRMIPVQSSFVRAIGYDDGELRIEFASGIVVAHYGVEPEKHSALISAESHGKFYNQHIRGKYGRPRAERPPGPSAPSAWGNPDPEPAPEHHDRHAMFEAALRRFRGEQ